jgi:hypothetical protein
VKRPDRKTLTFALAGVVAVGGVGCSGINATVPITPLLFMQNRPPETAPPQDNDNPAPALASNDAPPAGL